MKLSELQDKTVQDLNSELLELRKEQFKLRMQLGSGQSARTHRLKGVRRDIARVKTVINQRRNNLPAGGQA